MNQGQVQVSKIAELDFATGKVGLRHRLAGPAAEAEHARELLAHTLELTQTNTAFCGDERMTIQLADDTDDPSVLQSRVVPQLFGGNGLATTKALAAAGAAALGSVKTLKNAYESAVMPLLERLGEEDGAHDDCGAANAAKSSVENALPVEVLLPAYKLFLPDMFEDQIMALAQKNYDQKRTLLADGFYDDFDPLWHKDFVINRCPRNFSYLQVDTDDHEIHGHNGSSIYVITRPGRGFQKNGKAFAVTLPKMATHANKLGGSDEERTRILLAYIDDTLNIGAGLVMPGMPVFADVQVS